MWQTGSKESWAEVNRISSNIAPAALQGNTKLLNTSNISARRLDDLTVVDAANKEVQVLVGGGSQRLQTAAPGLPTGSDAPVSVGVDTAPVAVLAMPPKINGERDLMVLSSGQMVAAPAPITPTATITVNTTTDSARLPISGQCNGVSGDCSLREAVLKSNATAGSNQINVPAGTYNLTVTNPAPSATTGTGNFTSQDLQVGSATNNNATILGTGGTPLIHLATGTQDVITTGFNQLADGSRVAVGSDAPTGATPAAPADAAAGRPARRQRQPGDAGAQSDQPRSGPRRGEREATSQKP